MWWAPGDVARVCSSRPRQVVAQAGVFKMYPYEALKDKCPPDVDPSSKEVSWSHDST